MAQSLEKAFLQKVAQMPELEEEIPAAVPRGKQSKPKKGQKSCKDMAKITGYILFVHSVVFYFNLFKVSKMFYIYLDI